MSKVVLCAIEHKSGDKSVHGFPKTLMSAECLSTFDSLVLPRIGADSVIIAEGWKGRSSPGDADYQGYLRHIGGNIVTAGPFPLLLGCDVREQLTSPKMQKMAYHLRFVSRLAIALGDDSDGPETVAELKQMLLTPPDPAQFPEIENLEGRKSLRISRRYFEEFDRDHTRGAGKHANTEVFVIAGAAHAMRMHVLSGWEIVYCVPEAVSPELVKRWFWTYYAAYLYHL